ncbi:MAG: M15 family metallopeptidase [Rhodobacteraceae bacterium]|nr:M15 family metallopeptidase [Paracoccaceae bacterium]
MRIVPVIVGAIILLCIPLVWLLVQLMFPASDGLTSGFGASSSIDSGARIEIEALRQQVEGLQEKITALETEVRTLGAQALPQPEGGSEIFNQGPNEILNAYAQVVLIADRLNVNRGITVASPAFLEEFLGRPREVLSDQCEGMTNPRLNALLTTEQVGPVTVRMLRPALDSLKRVFDKIREADPDLYARINTSGSLCVRRIRGTEDSTSTHSFGLAIDLNIDGQLDNFTDGKTQLGLTILADFFHAEGWVWGAGFNREDSMHFEVSRQQLETWRAEGKI